MSATYPARGSARLRGRAELAPGAERDGPSRPRPGQAVAVAETAGGAGRALKVRVERRGACAFAHEVRVSRDEESGNVTDPHGSRSRGRLKGPYRGPNVYHASTTSANP